MKVCIIGGGASGMMAAIQIALKGHQVLLFEKNEKLGKKIYITGKGRCNLTNTATGNEFLNNVVNNQKFIMSSEVRFNSNDTKSFFEELGVELKTERGNRVFPVSDKASDITKAMEKRMKILGVEVRLNSKVKDILVSDGFVSGIMLENNEKIECDACVVATGGISYTLTGSTGDGYKFAEKLGHKIVDPVPALVGVISNDKSLVSLAGFSLKNVKLFAFDKKKKIFESEVGEMLFTGNGISGPLVLTMSSYINRFNPSEIKICIDFKPGLDEYMLSSRIERDIISLKSKQFSSLVENLLPRALVDIVSKRLNIKKDKKVSQLTTEERKSLCYMLKNFEIEYDRLDDIERAIITSGGVSVKDIKPKNMESKIINKLYFIGEVIDVDALTGGFNLQIAFSTAVACASDF